MSLANQLLSSKKASKGCWTCKARKIGCDKNIPQCHNCLRTGRSCEGYGIKLHWPESGDGRRPAKTWEHRQKESRGSIQPISDHIHFLNTTHDDLEHRTSCAWTSASARLLNPTSPAILRSLDFGFETSSSHNDMMLLAYCKSCPQLSLTLLKIIQDNEVLSRMITTIDDSRNGFRTVLIPSALSVQSLSSQSLREAILALSAFHLWGRQAAVKHKLRSIRLLSQSIYENENQHIGQFSTCMMLCVCDVFDAVDGSWYSHMRAANTICNQFRTYQATNDPTAYFLTTWLAYHKILSEFSHIPEHCDNEYTIPELPIEDPKNHVIIGSLGCSMQVLKCISCINHLATTIEQSKDEILPLQFASAPICLEKQLETLQQIPQVVEDSMSGKLDEARISNTAELYRLAALIYLHRSVTQKPVDDPELQLLVNSALSILTALEICTSPSPLFIIACEVFEDEQRVIIFDTLEKMQKERRIGNVEIMRNIIETVWKRADLNSLTDVKTRVNWKDLVDTRRQIPSFI